MFYEALRITITVALIIAIAEVSKRSTLMGGVLASLPLVAVLSMTWIYVETKDVARIATLAQNIFWLVLPSLAMFMIIPWLLKKGVNFYLSMGIGMAVTACGYGLVVLLLQRNSGQ